jgi:hypothetical protein
LTASWNQEQREPPVLYDTIFAISGRAAYTVIIRPFRSCFIPCISINREKERAFANTCTSHRRLHFFGFHFMFAFMKREAKKQVFANGIGIGGAFSRVFCRSFSHTVCSLPSVFSSFGYGTPSEIPTGAPSLSPKFGPTDSLTAASAASHWLAQSTFALISAALAFILS